MPAISAETGYISRRNRVMPFKMCLKTKIKRSLLFLRGGSMKANFFNGSPTKLAPPSTVISATSASSKLEQMFCNLKYWITLTKKHYSKTDKLIILALIVSVHHRLIVSHAVDVKQRLAPRGSVVFVDGENEGESLEVLHFCFYSHSTKKPIQ